MGVPLWVCALVLLPPPSCEGVGGTEKEETGVSEVVGEEEGVETEEGVAREVKDRIGVALEEEEIDPEVEKRVEREGEEEVVVEGCEGIKESEEDPLEESDAKEVLLVEGERVPLEESEGVTLVEGDRVPLEESEGVGDTAAESVGFSGDRVGVCIVVPVTVEERVVFARIEGEGKIEEVSEKVSEKGGEAVRVALVICVSLKDADKEGDGLVLRETRFGDREALIQENEVYVCPTGVKVEVKIKEKKVVGEGDL